MYMFQLMPNRFRIEGQPQQNRQDKGVKGSEGGR